MSRRAPACARCAAAIVGAKTMHFTHIRGAYFLANDQIYEMAVAFLNSFRHHNPELPLCLIPYDGRTSRVAALASQYRFEVFSDAEVLRRCDAMAARFYPYHVGEFRKAATWCGPWQSFAYIDVDTVMTRGLSSLWDLLHEFDVVHAHSDVPGSRRHTWNESIYHSGVLSATQIAYAANMGFFMSKQGAFSLAELEDAALRAQKLIGHMARTADQPFFNFAIITSNLRYTSFSRLRDVDGRLHFPHECWPGDPNWMIRRHCEFYYAGEHKDVLFVHWAGEWRVRPGEIAPDKTADGSSFVRPSMPQRELWLHYRYLDTAQADHRLASPPKGRVGAEDLDLMPG